MRISDLMTPDVITIGPGASLKEAARRMIEAGVSGIPVTDDDGGLVGIVTEADFLATEANRSMSHRRGRLIRLIGGDAGPADRERRVGDVMTRNLVTVSPDADHAEAARLMQRHSVKRLPVVTEGRLVGLVSRADILRAFARHDRDIVDEIRGHVIKGVLWTDPDEVEISCEDGDVRLSGRMQNRSDTRLLVELVKRVDGVASVSDRLSWQVDNTARIRGAGAFPPVGM